MNFLYFQNVLKKIKIKNYVSIRRSYNPKG